MDAYLNLHEKCYHLYLCGLEIEVIQIIWSNIDDLERSNIFDDHIKSEMTDSALGFVNQFMIEFISKVVYHLDAKVIRLMDMKFAINNIYMNRKLAAKSSNYGCDAIWYYNTFITELIETDIERKESRAETLRYIYGIKKSLRCNNIYKIDNDAVIYLSGVIDAVIEDLIKRKTLRGMVKYCESDKFKNTYVEVVNFKF
jgi:hypothetical protein